MGKRVLLPVPDREFDATEVAVPWRILTRAGHEVVFATEKEGPTPACDARTIHGPMFGLFGAGREARTFYREMEGAPEFRRTISWSGLDPSGFDGLLLPGGHAPGMRQYLDSEALQRTVAAFWDLERPVAAICHGVLVLARARAPRTGKSVLSGSRTTCLPKFAERMAYLATAWKLGRYYRTYPAYVEDEVRAALDNPAQQFVRGPLVLDFGRIVRAHEGSALVVEDGRYMSGRWPGDAYLLAQSFLRRIEAGGARVV